MPTPFSKNAAALYQSWTSNWQQLSNEKSSIENITKAITDMQETVRIQLKMINSLVTKYQQLYAMANIFISFYCSLGG